MSIEVNGKTIATDEEGFLLNPDDWNEDTMEALIKQHEAAGHKPVNETARGLVEYFREYYEDKMMHPSMHKLILTLGKVKGKHFRDQEEYKKFLYELFPHGPVIMLSKLAGLPKPVEEVEA
ncbi:TusE/DsrC/DsvC family sulfur relay protein [sulfur-oxidizing endosymbiont of Gigantopelta aegis]|uniref:TusE/DsrC/DsvC family sulfur relay protein n=1 Tax=sulfur-oxidizing endosymbiont of Gigantopelta aegis TaxID=2794934 RepID=UPI0018DD9871|nr:TusE/DsrC/DsvC family sulfur relay protein [sulfur-oxidizing endosymbiont of Gigantopelta aegis]